MSVVPLQPERAAVTPPVSPGAPRSVYLDAYLAPLRPWLRQRLAASGELLYAWTRLLDPLHLQARGPDARASPAQRRVADVLDAYRSEQLDLARWLPPDVLDWHAAASLCR